MKKKVAIIGAGLAGLNCARVLSKNSDNYDITIYDSNEHIGGRVVTRKKDGFLLDEGFQVLLPGYPEAQTAFDLEKLNLKDFRAGANIRLDNTFYNISDPMREPMTLLSTLSAPIGSFFDKLKILKLKSLGTDGLDNLSCLELLQQMGFSQKMIDSFFIPFFSGVFLEPNLNVPAKYFAFIYQCFSNSNAALPEKGMGDLAQNLLDQCKGIQTNLGSKVEILNKNEIQYKGEKRTYDFIVKAYQDAPSDYYKVTTDYFHIKEKFLNQPILYLNGDRSGCINHIAPLTQVQSSYAEEGELLSVNLIGANTEKSIEQVEKDLSDWFPNRELNHIHRCEVKKALPASTSFGQSLLLKEGLFHCGDHLESPSINGALKSGRKAAEAIKVHLYQN